jgi:hypothetical protein
MFNMFAAMFGAFQYMPSTSGHRRSPVLRLGYSKYRCYKTKMLKFYIVGDQIKSIDLLCAKVHSFPILRQANLNTEHEEDYDHCDVENKEAAHNLMLLKTTTGVERVSQLQIDIILCVHHVTC